MEVNWHMADDRDKQGLPWTLQRDPPVQKAGGAEFDPTSAVYRLYTNTRNPYLKRAFAPSAERLERSPTELQQLFRFFGAGDNYQVSPTNTATATRKRHLEHPLPAAPPNPQFQTPSALPGNLVALPWMVDEFFRAVLERLRDDPGGFDELVSELVGLLEGHGIQIRLNDAYTTFADWDDLMSTLEEISHYPAVETFDLFCSALLTYHELAYPPEG